MKGKSKALEEFGKQLLNIGVAIIVFAVLQPIISNEFKVLKVLLFIALYLLITVVGIIFIKV